MTFRSVFAAPWAPFFILIAALLAGCGEEAPPVPEAGLHALEAFATIHAPNPAWKVRGVSIDDDGKVVVDVLVSEKDVHFIRARPRIQQAHLVETMCPPTGDPAWRGVPSETKVWVALNTKTGSVTGSSCRR